MLIGRDKQTFRRFCSFVAFISHLHRLCFNLFHAVLCLPSDSCLMVLLLSCLLWIVVSLRQLQSLLEVPRSPRVPERLVPPLCVSPLLPRPSSRLPRPRLPFTSFPSPPSCLTSPPYLTPLLYRPHPAVHFDASPSSRLLLFLPLRSASP